MKFDNLTNEEKIELIKISEESYKNHFDWTVRLFVVYLTLIGVIFNAISKSENESFHSFLFLIIIIASLVFIVAGYYVGLWVVKYKKNIKVLAESLDFMYDHLTYPSSKVPILIFISCLSILAATFYQYFKLAS